jgi:antitoxin ParD1/3/4
MPIRFWHNPGLDTIRRRAMFTNMTITLPPALNQLVDRLVHSGRYADEADVLREALRVLERQEFDESPALEAAILEGVASPHQPYDASLLDRIRRNARSSA